MYHVIDRLTACELDGKRISVRDFLATDWTDHVYLIPEDYEKGYGAVPLTRTVEDSVRILTEKYIDRMAVYMVREKDFGDGAVGHWIYLGVLVSRSEYEEAYGLNRR